MKILTSFLAVCLACSLVGCGNDKTDDKTEQQYGFLTGNDVFLREIPSTSGKPLTTLNKNTKVEVLGTDIAVSNKGYIVTDDKVFAIDVVSKQEVILHRGLALTWTQEKTERGDGIFEFNAGLGQKKKVLIKNVFNGGSYSHIDELRGSNWFNVKLEDGKEGWVYGDFLAFVLRECDKKQADKFSLKLEGLADARTLISSPGTIMGIPYNSDFDSGLAKLDAKEWKGSNTIGLYGPHYLRNITGYGLERITLNTTSKQYMGYFLENKDGLKMTKYYYAIEKQADKVYGNPVRKAGKYRVYKFSDGVVALGHSGLASKPRHIYYGVFSNKGYEECKIGASGFIDWYKSNNKPFNEEEVVFDSLLLPPQP